MSLSLSLSAALITIVLLVLYAVEAQYPVAYWRSLPWIHTVWFDRKPK